MDAPSFERKSQDAFLALTSDGIWRISASGAVPTYLPAEEQVALIWQQGVLAECNDAFARLYGAESATELVGRPMSSLLVENETNRSVLLSFVRDGYRLSGVETVETTIAGERRYFLNSMVGVVRDGLLVEAWGTQADITERKRRESQARQLLAMDAVSRLAGSVAHDFNNLLTTILTSAEILSDSLQEGHVGHHDVEEIRRSARQGAELTRQLLSMSRQQVLAPRATDVGALVCGLEGRLRAALPAGTGITITTQREAAIAHVDAEELEQTLVHLATHASSAMRAPTPTFTVSVRREHVTVARAADPDEIPAGDYVLVRLWHTSMQTTPEPTLVQPFIGAETASLGSGLAMATVHGFMLESGGALAFESSDGGVAYSLYFPASAHAAVREAAPPPATVSAEGKRTVLLAEDEPTVRLLMKRVLERAGYAVLVATDGREALDLSRAYGSTIDVLVTDVIMPGMGGGELSRRMRSERPSIKVLHVSGYTAGALRHQEALEDGAAFLQKPFAAATLMSKLKEVLAG